MLNYQAGNSPLEARGAFPIGIFFVILFIVIIIIGLFYIISKKRHDYYNSDKYKEKERNRPTTRKDVKIVEKENGLSSDQGDLLWEICNITKATNIIYSIRDNNIMDLFRSAYKYFIDHNAPDEKLYEYFILLYRIEVIISKNKAVSNTRFIPVSEIIFFLTENGEQLPLPLVQNTQDSFSLEIPQFLYTEQHRPKILVPTRFIYRTKQGLSYNIVARIIRYDISHEDQYLMVVGHSDNIVSQVQRHFKRDYLERDCAFSPIRIDRNHQDNVDTYVYSPKKYAGKIINLSAGGCCIRTDLPIKEGQHLRVFIPDINTNENIIGIIKRTRKLPINGFGIHIQFVRISLKSQNKISSLVYKFEL